MNKIVLATGNKGKVAEFAHLFEQYNIEVFPQSDFDVPDVPETGTTFVENAIIKARHAASLTGLAAIADDSGLVVEALDGAPGIYSARYAGEEATDTNNCEKLLSALSNTNVRQAKFLCVLVFLRHAKDPTPIICQGEWEGEITRETLGNGGFGYDPIFYVPTLKRTAAELSKDEKSSISHRAKALVHMMQQLNTHIL
jgi:XTP/dITP diphosphohydrolase